MANLNEEMGKAEKLEVKEPEIVKTTMSMIQDAIKKRASDIHLERMEKRARIRCRIDGVLKELANPPSLEVYDNMVSRIKIMAGMDVAEKKLPQDGRIKLELAGKRLDLRVSTSPCLFGESVVMRILDRESVIVGLEYQGFTDENLKTLEKWYSKRNGIILVSGPTGCGKTTTLYSIVEKLNTESIKISTIEDPVEYAIEGVNQMQHNARIGLTFGAAIRTILRQDPDVIMVGEIRDLETAQLEIQAALTGHLVLSTLHTYDAPSGIIRLLDMGVEPFLINASLIGILCQRLVRTICEDCKEEYTPESWVLDSVKPKGKAKFFRGRGCEKCNKTGYRGRIAIHELFELSDTSKKLISDKVGAEELRKNAIEQGLKTIKEDGIAKAIKGITTIEEVIRVCY